VEVVDRVRRQVDAVAVDVRDGRDERDCEDCGRRIEPGEDEHRRPDHRQRYDQVDPVAGEHREVVEDEDRGREGDERRLRRGEADPFHGGGFAAAACAPAPV
jgi:hypothetical protein